MNAQLSLRKLLTIVCEADLETLVVRDLKTLGARGYTITDARGCTTTQDVTVDTQAPQYGITIDSISEDTGQSGSDFITMDTTLTMYMKANASTAKRMACGATWPPMRTL